MLSKNKKGINILTVNKLGVIYFLLQNQVSFKSLMSSLELGGLKNESTTLYDNSENISDFLKSDCVGLIVSYLCNINKIKLVKVEGVGYLEIFDGVDIPINEIANEFFLSNVSTIKRLASMAEPKLLKSVMGL
ncbi:hypothetical protein TUM4261_33160 [Shewanella sp. c952]|uniref:hypothetical protein n=1 Tax=Shewanella sp. c952 TaxID=2815913 RepID=UPI001BC0B7B9|nr:hypothetical protein [Shewanella sp. c952]GIU15713.1 hypothetical protein TUM4261_33160 [Shewanella sp. c952]